MRGSIFRHLRFALFVVGVAAWLVCLWTMLKIAVPWHDIAVEPPPQNKLAGVAWFFYGWSVPVGLSVASMLLYSGWPQFRAVSRTATLAAASTVPLVAAGVLTLFLNPFEPIAVVAMEVGIGVHFLAVVLLLGVAIGTGRLPWRKASEWVDEPSRRLDDVPGKRGEKPDPDFGDSPDDAGA